MHPSCNLLRRRSGTPPHLLFLDREQRSFDLSGNHDFYTREQRERLERIHARLIEARRELDALIGDAYLRPRASIVPVHFLDLASAVEKLRWAEKEWRELDQEIASARTGAGNGGAHPREEESLLEDEPDPELVDASGR